MFRVMSRMSFATVSQALGPVLSLMLVLAATVVASHPAQAQTYTVLHSFNFSVGNDGAMPSAGLILDAHGNLYGTTKIEGLYHGGVVFKLAPTRKETVLYPFGNGSDGAFPMAGLVQDSAGNLYGTTSHGGTGGTGAVFELNKVGNETLLHSFGRPPSDGELPMAGLIRDAKGNLYGTTPGGGKRAAGIVFKLSKSGETILYNFCSNLGCKDGGFPAAGLIEDGQGNLYGTTERFGTGGFAGGTVFKLDPKGKGTETVLYNFSGGSDGGKPVAGLIQDAAGNSYGTTMAGGNSGNGVVFELSNTRTETVLWSFTGGNDGSTPVAGVILDSAGNLYGTTKMGGTSNNGVVFKLAPQSGGKWTETVLHSFTGGTDGGQPLGGLIQDKSSGYLYGTASMGGKYGEGVVFKLVP